MATMAFLFQFTATFCTGLFSGAALYISRIEQFSPKH